MKTLDVWTVEELEDEIASISARIAVATARMLECLGELDRRGTFGEGFVSLAHWLHWRTGLRLPSAREHVRVARALRELPLVREALGRGEISYSKVRAITRIATKNNEAQLVSMAQGGSTSQLERVVRGVRRVGLNEKEEAERVAAKRYLQCWHDDDGMLVLQGRLSAEEGALLLKAMEVARSEAFKAKAPTDRAAQLMRMAERSLGGAARPGGDRTLVVVHVDEEVLKDRSEDGTCQLDGGPSVSAETCRRMACDASTVEIKHGEGGRVVDAGRRKRRISRALQRAVAARDQGHCVFPGCMNQIVDGHHVEHWADGGQTVLGNVFSLCRQHHVLVHEGGWRMEVGDRARFWRPDGREFELVPPPPRDLSPLRAVEAERWLQVTQGWRDVRPDYDEAVASALM